MYIYTLDKRYWWLFYTNNIMIFSCNPRFFGCWRFRLTDKLVRTGSCRFQPCLCFKVLWITILFEKKKRKYYPINLNANHKHHFSFESNQLLFIHNFVQQFMYTKLYKLRQIYSNTRNISMYFIVSSFHNRSIILWQDVHCSTLYF